MDFPAHLLQRIVPSTPLPRLGLPPAAIQQIETIASDLRPPAPRIPTTALFLGSDRTTPALAAEALAHSLGRDLLRIDIAKVADHYIGETEKNLRELLQSTDPSRAILFFDEADALFGKRTDVKDSHDRFSSLEAEHILRLLQTFPGLSILGTTSVTNPLPGVNIRYTVHLPQIPPIPPAPAL